MRYGAPTPPAKAVVEAGVRPDGQLEYATIYASSSVMVLDRAALEIIRNSTFSPKVVDCKAVEAKQLYVVDFSNAPPTLSPTAFPSPSPSPYVQ
jgi:TonB family protein